MPVYQYVARNAEGHTVNGRLEAADKVQLVQLLGAKQLTPVTMDEAVKKERVGGLFSSTRVPLSEIVIFARQLATMIDAGIPILQALEIAAEQTEHRGFKRILTDIAKRVASGSSIYKALSQHTRIFSEFFVHVVKAGEESGNLDEILDRIASYLEKTEKLIRKVKSALVYPAVVMTMAVAVTVLMLVKVIPVFVDIYAGSGAALPLPTQILISLSNWLRAYFVWIIIAVVMGIFGLIQFSRTENGGMIVDRFKLRMPIFGPLIRKAAVSKFTRTLGTLLKSGVPILRAIDIVAKTAGNRVLEKAIVNSGKYVREGRKLSEPFQESKVFPPMVIRMMAVGEASGEMEKMLEKIADFYDDQVDAAVSGLTSMIEPLIIAFLGIVIGGIVIAMFLPMFQMVNMIQ